MLPDQAKHGLERLRAAFPPERLHELVQVRDGIPAHPVVQDYVFKGSRFELIQLAVAIERFEPAQLRDRLLNRCEYVGFCAEMLAGLTLASTGAALVHEPVGRGKAGPDWLATWRDGQNLIVEVKCPSVSKSQWRLSLVTTNLQWVLMARFNHSESVCTDRETWIRLEFSDAFVRQAANSGLINDAGIANKVAFDKMADQAMDEIESLSWPVPDGRYSMGSVGDFCVRCRANSEPKFHFGGPVTSSDIDHELDRLRDDLMRACEQLIKMPNSPQVIVLETLYDSWIPIRSSGIAEIIETESWAANLAGVLVFDRQVNDLPDCVVTPIAGKRWEALEPLISGVRLCSHEHFHADLGIFPPPECTGRW